MALKPANEGVPSEATEGVAGVMRFATTDEAEVGTVPDAAITPATLRNVDESTGLISGFVISINVVPTKIDIGVGRGIVVDGYTDPENPVRVPVNFTGLVDVVLTHINTDPTTILGVDAAGELVQKTELFTPEELRDVIYIGFVNHVDLTTVDTVSNQIEVPIGAPSHAISDMGLAVGSIRTKGDISGVPGEAKFARSTYDIFRLGFNQGTSRKNPHYVTRAALTPQPLYAAWREGGGVDTTALITTFDPSVYDDNTGGTGPGGIPNGTLQPHEWQVVELRYSIDGEVLVAVYGQQNYQNCSLALADVGTVTETDVNLDQIHLWGVLVVNSAATDFSNEGEAIFLPADRFGQRTLVSGHVSAGVASIEGWTNGCVLEVFTIRVNSTDGVNVLATVERDGGGDIPCQFEGRTYTLASTPAATIALTPGTDTSPTTNFVFLEESGGVVSLATNTTGFPTTPHVTLGYSHVQSAPTVQADGKAYTNRRRMNEVQDHAQHLGHRLAGLPAVVRAGCVGSSDITVNAGSLDNVDFAATAGVVDQVHQQPTSNIDTSTGSLLRVMNHATNAWGEISDLNEITEDSSGGSLSGTRYTVVIHVVTTADGSWYAVNLPTGSYSTDDQATSDADNKNVYTLVDPGTMALVWQGTFRHRTQDNGTITLLEERNLVTNPITGTGGSAQATTFPTGAFRIYDDSDPTKRLATDMSDVETGATRTRYWPNRDVNMANVGVYASGVGGSANEITLTSDQAVVVYHAGLVLSFVAGGANTGSVTVNASGVGAVAVQFRGAALAGGEIDTDHLVLLVHDGTQFQLVSPAGGTGGEGTGDVIKPAAPGNAGKVAYYQNDDGSQVEDAVYDHADVVWNDTGDAAADANLTISDGETRKVKDSTKSIANVSFTNETETRSASINMADQVLQRPELKDWAETGTTPTSTSGAITLDMALGNVFTTTLTEDITALTIGNPPDTGKGGTATWIVTQHTSDAKTITLPTGGVWMTGTAPDFSTLDAVYVITYKTTDAGTSWVVAMGGGGGGGGDIHDQELDTDSTVTFTSVTVETSEDPPGDSPQTEVWTSSSSTQGHALTSNAVDAWKAFNGTVALYAQSTTAPFGYVTYDYGDTPLRVIASYDVTAWNQNLARTSKDWTFEGSLNGIDFDILDTVTGETNWSVSELRSFTIPAILRKPYRYYRFNVTANNGDATYWVLAELALNGYEKVSSAPPATSQTGIHASNVSAEGHIASASLSPTTAWTAFTGLEGATWQKESVTFPFQLGYQFAGLARTIVRYEIATYPNNPERMPSDFTFEGSTNGSAWDVLDTVTGATAYPWIYNVYAIDEGNWAPYNYHRINVTAVASGTVAAVTSFRLFGYEDTAAFNKMESTGRNNASGPTGIGTEDPQATLDVVNVSDALALRAYRNGTTTTDSILECYSDHTATSTLVAAIRNNGDINTYTGVVSSFSDRTLKNTVKVATSKLPDLLKLSVRSYYMNGDPDTKLLGVIADEVKGVFPSLVVSIPQTQKVAVIGPDGRESFVNAPTGESLDSVKYSVFTPILIISVQELNKIVVDLTQEVQDLKQEVQDTKQNAVDLAERVRILEG